ncbi:flagellin [Sulfitobacter sp. LCG007]
MRSMSLGDLAHSHMLQRRSVSVRKDLSRLTADLASGKISDLRQVLVGNHSYLTDIERSLKVLGGHSVANSEASQFLGGMQRAMDRVQEITGKLGSDLITAGNGSVAVISGTPSENAKVQLAGMMGLLNGQMAGRSMFAGTATDTAPLATSQTLLTQLQAVVSGLPDAATMLVAAQAWFDAPGGFDAMIYSGSTTALAPFRLSDEETISVDVRANDPAFKQLLMNTAMAALAQDPATGLALDQQSEMFMSTGLGLQGAQIQLTAVRAEIGFAEARIETVNARNEAEQASLDYARTNLLAADPFKTATQLEEVQFQLESLYAITVRSSQLALVNFL